MLGVAVGYCSCANGGMMVGRQRGTLVVLCLAALVCLAPGVWAGAASTTFQVAATVEPRCSVQAQALNLGPYDPFVAHARVGLSGVTSFQVRCTKGVNARLLLEPVSPQGGSERVMTWGDQRLRYALFKDRNLAAPWLPGEEGAIELAVTSGHSTLEVPVAAWVPPGQVVLSGWYADVVTARLEF